MLKLRLILFLCAGSFVATAQNKPGQVQLYVHREINGVTEIIDTTFESKAAMNDFLRSLPPADLNVGNMPHVHIHRFNTEGEKIYIDRHLRLADSLLNRSRVYYNDADVFNRDSIFTRFKFENDSSWLGGRWFSYPDSADTSFFRFHLPENEQFFTMAHRAKKFAVLSGKSKKYFQFKAMDETDKKLLPNGLNQQLSVTSPPLTLEDLKIFPNPGDGLVQLSFRVKDQATLKIRVLNAAGQAIFSETLPGVSGLYMTEIDLRNAGKGVYYVSVVHGKKSAVRKLIIN